MVVIFVATFTLVLFGIVFKRWRLKKSDKPVPLVFVEMVDLAFPDLEKNKENEYDVFGQQIDSYAFSVLTAIIIPIISSTCFITFWNVYAVEEMVGGGCVDNYDCFPRMDSEFLQREPVANCSILPTVNMPESLNNSNDSSIPLEPDITYNCYRLVFRYAEGFGAAGGILLITALFSKIYFSILVSIRKVVKDTDDCWCRFLLYSIVWFVCAFIFIAFLAINLGIPEVRATVFLNVTDTIQFVMYVITLALIIITGVIVAIGIEDP